MSHKVSCQSWPARNHVLVAATEGGTLCRSRGYIPAGPCLHYILAANSLRLVGYKIEGHDKIEGHALRVRCFNLSDTPIQNSPFLSQKRSICPINLSEYS